MKKYIVLASAVFILTLILSACGAPQPKTTINVTMTDFRFEPMNFIIPAGEEITINAVNSGAVVHQFVIMKYGQNIGDAFGTEDEPNVYWKIEVGPGQTKTDKFTAPTDIGEYQLVCGTEGHFQAGMAGTITVTDK